MTSHRRPETTLTGYCSSLDQILARLEQSLQPDKKRKLRTWLEVMRKLLEHLDDRHSSRPGKRKHDAADTLFPRLTSGIQDTLLQLEAFPRARSSLSTPHAFEDLFERVQLHTSAIDLLSCYYERYACLAMPPTTSTDTYPKQEHEPSGSSVE